MKRNRSEFVPKLAVIILAAGGCFGLEGRNAHAQGVSTMRHEPLIVVGDRIFMEVGDGVSEIGEITHYCLGCHDGAIGPARQTPELRPAGGNNCTGLPGVHPVGARYPAGSITCHDLLQESHGLVVSNRRSALCLTCHRK
jgi:hypothetical protein